MAFGIRFRNYMKAFPNADKLSANRCSKLPYKELKGMAKNLYNHNNDCKNNLYRYMNMNKGNLANAVYRALGTL